MLQRFRIEQMLITCGKTAQQGYLSEKLAQCCTLNFWPVDAGVTLCGLSVALSPLFNK